MFDPATTNTPGSYLNFKSISVEDSNTFNEVIPKEKFVNPAEKNSTNLLSSLVFYRTYPKTLENGRKETPLQTIQRVEDMHTEKYPQYKELIHKAFDSVRSKKVVPSMRSMQFAGEPIKRSNSRIFNCFFVNIVSWKNIADLFFQLMNGGGVGYSVQSHHVSQIPVVPKGKSGIYVIADSKEAWSDSIIELGLNPQVEFDYSLIRKQNSKLSTGGTASGPEPLREVHEKVRAILKGAEGRKLIPIEVHSIVTLVSDCVVVGGVRRSSLISLFDVTDKDMLYCKTGEWWKKNPQFARANNSAVLLRSSPTFMKDLEYIIRFGIKNKTGEPGLFLTNNLELGGNPCFETSLKSNQGCNLTESDASACETEEEFLDSIRDATIIGTLQAGYTNFVYIDKKWKEMCEEDSLLGVSITGQAENWGLLTEETLQKASKIALETNEKWANMIGINKASRIGLTKPSGTTSAYLGCTSGIHAAHSPFYLRRVRVDLSDPISRYLISKFGVGEANGGFIVEKDAEKPTKNIIVTIPISKKGAILRSEESAVDLLNRAKHIFDNWIKPTHRKGENYNNVSLTVTYKDSDVEPMVKWLLENTGSYSGITTLPYDKTSYVQAPFEEITEEDYKFWLSMLNSVDLDFSNIDFTHVEDLREGELSCVGGACEFK